MNEFDDIEFELTDDKFKKIHGGLSREEIEYQAEQAFEEVFGEGEEGIQAVKEALEGWAELSDKEHRRILIEQKAEFAFKIVFDETEKGIQPTKDTIEAWLLRDDEECLHGLIERKKELEFKIIFGEGEKGIQAAKDILETWLDLHDEIFQRALEAGRRSAAKPKLMTSTKQSENKLENVIKDLKYLLNQTGFEYTIDTERNNTFAEILTIKVETATFGACSNDHIIMKNIINTVDSFDSATLTKGVNIHWCKRYNHPN